MIFIQLVGLFLISRLHFCNCDVDLKADDDTDPCESILESFAFKTGNFTYCAIYFARPIRLCQLCHTEYSKVRIVYNDISNYNPTGGEFCKDKLFNLDRLQVVDSGFKYVTGLWARAKCDSCFKLDKDKDPVKLKPGVEKMIQIYTTYGDCVKNHTNDSLASLHDPEVCNDCVKYYDQINKQYSFLKGPSGEEDICMDIVDLVNQTRLQWSTSLGCYIDRKQPETVYLIITGFISLIPIIFYFFTWCLITKKQQLVALQTNVPDYLKYIHRRASNAIINR